MRFAPIIDMREHPLHTCFAPSHEWRTKETRHGSAVETPSPCPTPTTWPKGPGMQRINCEIAAAVPSLPLFTRHSQHHDAAGGRVSSWCLAQRSNVSDNLILRQRQRPDLYTAKPGPCGLCEQLEETDMEDR